MKKQNKINDDSGQFQSQKKQCLGMNQSNRDDILYDLKKCQIHRNATSFGQPLGSSKSCECCGQKYQKSAPTSILFDRSEISYYGQGLTLYFEFMKMATIMAFIVMMTYGLPNIITNYRADSCMQKSEIHCSNTIFVKTAAINKVAIPESFKVQSYLSILAILGMFIAVQIFRKRFQDIQIQIDKIAGPQKYAIFISVETDQHSSGLSEKNIRKHIKQWWDKQVQLNPKKMNKLLSSFQNFKIQELQKLTNEVFISYDVHLAKQLKNRMLELTQQVQMEKSHSELNNMKIQLQTMKLSIPQVDVRVNSKFLVIFQYEALADYFYARNSVSRLSICLGKNKQNFFKYEGFTSRVYRAPLPNEILWENHHIRGSKKIQYRIGIYALSFLLLLMGQGLVFLILYLWFTYGDDKSNISTYISSLVSGFIVVINFFLYEMFIFISKYQYRSVILEDHISRSIKIIICVCFNSGILLLAAYFILDIQSIWHQNGFVDTISYTFIYAIVTPHALKYFNLYNFVKLFRYFKVQGEKAVYTQKIANLHYQKPQSYQPYHYYSWQITLLWMACFFGPILPLAFFCVFLTFLIQYWVQKFNYLYIYKERKPWGSLLNKGMTQIIEVSEFLLALGEVCLQLILKTLRGESLEVQSVIISLILLGFTTLHIFIIPKESMVKLLSCWYCREHTKRYDLSFEQAKDKFITNYQKQANKYFRKESIYNAEIIRNQLSQKIDQLIEYIQKVRNESNQVDRSLQNTNQNLFDKKGTKNIQITQFILQEDAIDQPNNVSHQPNKRLLITGTLKTIKQESQYLSNSIKFSNI